MKNATRLTPNSNRAIAVIELDTAAYYRSQIPGRSDFNRRHLVTSAKDALRRAREWRRSTYTAALPR